MGENVQEEKNHQYDSEKCEKANFRGGNELVLKEITETKYFHIVNSSKVSFSFPVCVEQNRVGLNTTASPCTFRAVFPSEMR